MPLNPPQDYRKTRFTHRIGLRVDQPLATDVLEGTIYFVTDELVLERSNGTIWEAYSGSSSPSSSINSSLMPFVVEAEESEYPYIILPGDVVRQGTTPVLQTLTTLNKATIGTLLDLSGSIAGQIQFPATQNPSSDVNTIDDYEEGTWTPTIGGNTSQSGQVYAIQVGSYVKIGKWVFVNFAVKLSTLGTITGQVQIKGLPFPAANIANLNASLSFGYFEQFNTAIYWLTGFCEPNASAAYLRILTSASTALFTVAQANLTANTHLIASMIYPTDN